VITDSHAHLYWKSYDADRGDVIDRAREAGVTRMIVVGTDVASSRAARELCAEHLELYPTAGIHPHDADASDDDARAVIEELCRAEECVAVGETGLDFFKEYSPRRAQFESLYWHLDLARRIDKPVVIHCRDAHPDCARVLAEFPGVRGVMHCYTMGAAELAPYLELGLYISFSGVVTYPRNDDNRAAAAQVPEERLLVETDCPFLAPQATRGKRNEPAYVRDVLACVAEVRGVELADLARATSDNAARLFGLSPLA
jgi:TatD DNase family protein